MVRPRMKDNHNWSMIRSEFLRWNFECGPYTVDACCDHNGVNAQVPGQYWSDCLTVNWDGHTVWVNPPYTCKDTKVSTILRHFELCRERTPATTSAVFILPYFEGSSQPAEWDTQLKKMKNMELLHTYGAREKLFR